MLKREQSTPRISSSHAECFYTAVKVRRQMVSQTYLNCGEFISWIVEINLSIMGDFKGRLSPRNESHALYYCPLAVMD